MRLANAALTEIIEWRRMLHRHPEISGEERETAARVAAFLQPTRPDEVVTGLGGHGVAAVYGSGKPGPTVLLRSEIDALPIEEISDIPHRSTVSGKAHLCGHDGHSAILAAVARELAVERPRKGRVVLMFQPAEETGAGAAAVIADPRFGRIAPDYAFSLHNLPGLPLGHASVSTGPVNCASRGMCIALNGRTSHASAPEDGISPMLALSRLMPALTALGPGGALDRDYRLVTVTHAAMGEPAFGIAPGYAEVWATLRTLTDDRMADICAAAEHLVGEATAGTGLGFEISYHDIFHHCENHPEAVALLRRAMDDEGIAHDEGLILRASEDFGLFGRNAKSAMFYFGAGESSPRLHNPDYDFPDALIEPAARIFLRTVRNLLG